MFYDAMLANNVVSTKANLMYYAVYYGGPRWSEATIRNNLIDVSNCRACVSAEVADAHASSGSNRRLMRRRASRVQKVTFDYNTPTLSVEEMASIDAKMTSGEITSIEQIEAMADRARPQTQDCPQGFGLDQSTAFCAFGER